MIIHLRRPRLQDVPLDELPGRIADLALGRELQKSWWQLEGMTDAAAEEIAKVNSSGGRETFSVAHLQQPWPQARFEWTPDTHVWDAERLARTWGTVKLAIRAAQRSGSSSAGSS